MNFWSGVLPQRNLAFLDYRRACYANSPTEISGNPFGAQRLVPPVYLPLHLQVWLECVERLLCSIHLITDRASYTYNNIVNTWLCERTFLTLPRAVFFSFSKATFFISSISNQRFTIYDHSMLAGMQHFYLATFDTTWWNGFQGRCTRSPTSYSTLYYSCWFHTAHSWKWPQCHDICWNGWGGSTVGWSFFRNAGG